MCWDLKEVAFDALEEGKCRVPKHACKDFKIQNPGYEHCRVHSTARKFPMRRRYVVSREGSSHSLYPSTHAAALGMRGSGICSDLKLNPLSLSVPGGSLLVDTDV